MKICKKMGKKKLWLAIGIPAAVLAITGIILAIVLPKKKKVTYEVSFALARKYEALAEVVILPEQTNVSEGTAIDALPVAEMTDFIFTGWYYDAELTMPTGPKDTVSKNMTLYPSFDTKIGRDSAFKLNYVSSLDVAEAFTVDIATYGLTREQVLELLRVRNITLGGQDEFFILKEKDDGQEGQETLPKYDETEVPSLFDEPLIAELMKKDDLSLDESVLADLREAGVDPDCVTEKELLRALGLPEEDSLIRYMREEMDIDIETALEMRRILDENEKKRTVVYYTISALSDKWMPGATHQIELLDTARMRFVFDGELTSESVECYNFTVFREQMNNLTLVDGMLYIPADEVNGVNMASGVYSLETGENGISNATETNAGIMEYAGTLAAGDVAAVYSGRLNADGTVDGDVTYIKISDVVEEGRYAYESAGFSDIIAQKDILPIPDDGTFDDGTVTVSRSDLDFSAPFWEQLKLDASTTVNEGDFLAFYKGEAGNLLAAESTGYGVVEGVTVSGNSVTITYRAVTSDEILEAYDMFSTKNDIEIPLEEGYDEQVRAAAEEQILESGFIDETRDYMMAVLTGEEFDVDKSEHAEELKQLSFRTQDGREIGLEELQKLAGGSKRVKISDDPDVRFSLGTKLSHFSGTGIRAEVTAGFTIEIELNTAGSKQNKLEIKIYAAFEQEITLGLNITTSSDWKWYAFIPVIQEIHVSASFTAGTYTGFGASVTIMTGSDNTNEDTPWNKLISTSNAWTTKEAEGLAKMGEKLEGISSALKAATNGGTYAAKEGKGSAGEDDDGAQYQGVGGDLPTKYSSMLSNDAEYINIVKLQLFKLSASPDPLHLVEFSFETSFVVSLKVNAMLGAGISYGNAKQYCFNIDVFSGEKSTDNADLETPNFRADAYAFGMIGVRGGVLFDARVGLISTALDSIGITAEAGFYAEVYGFVYISYTWKSGEGSSSSAQGSVYFEMGSYLDINFLAQLGSGKLSTGASIYSNKWPLVKLGAEEVPMEFEISQSDARLKLEIPEGKNTVSVPDDLFKLNMMSLTSGELNAKSQDSAQKGELAYKFNINGREYCQYSEKNFSVTCYDLDGANGSVLPTHSFRYLPESNEIYVKPTDSTKDELWGVVTFVYKNNSFGFNTLVIKRDVYVHWKGTPTTAEVLFYVQNEKGDGWDYVKSGEFTGFDGVQYDLVVDREFFYQLPGYRMVAIGFDDMTAWRNRISELQERCRTAFRQLNNGQINKAEYLEIERECYAAEEGFRAYNDEIDKVFKEEKGALHFLMCSQNTVVRLYFYPEEYLVSWVINPEKCYWGGVPGWHMIGGVATTQQVFVGRGCGVMDTMPSYPAEYFAEHSKEHAFTWYYYKGADRYAPVSYADAFAHEDEWKPLSADMTVESNMVVIGFEENYDIFTLNWSDGEKIIDSAEVRAGDPIPSHAGVDPGEEGLHFNFWMDENGYGGIKVMPRSDLTLYANISPLYYWIRCYEENYSRCKTQMSVAYGDKFLDRLEHNMNLPVKTGYKLEFYTEREGEKFAVPDDATMPARDLDLYARHVPREYKVTWIDGTDSREETHCYDSWVTLSNAVRADGSECIWYLDGESVSGNFKMPSHDIELQAVWGIHNWEVESTVASTCCAQGEAKKVCTDCGIVKTEYLPLDAKKHPKSEWRFSRRVKAATCVSAGAAEYVCRMCGETFEDVSIYEPAPNLQKHIGEEWVVVQEPTCAEYGRGQWKCPGCETVLAESEIGLIDHDYVFEKVSDEANCLNPQRDLYRCTVCGQETVKKKDDVLNPNNHPITHTAIKKKPTCKENGYTGDTVCSICGKILEKGTVIPATGKHAYLSRGRISEATCCKPPVEAVRCTVCGEESTREESFGVNPDNHINVVTGKDAKAATCGADGYSGDTYCNDCKKIVKKGSVIPATGKHDFTLTKTIEESTCCKVGKGEYTCRICHKSETGNLETGLNAQKHENLSNGVNAKKATCGADGYTGDVYCNDCKKTVTKGTVIPATGQHSFVFHKTVKAATETENGIDEYQCLTCGKTENRATGKKAPEHQHKPVLKNARNATCSESGYSGDTYCSECNQLITAGKTVPATGEHDYQFSRTLTEATCSKGGTEEYKCKNCGKTETGTTAKNPDRHTAVQDNVGRKAETCQEDGYTGDSVCRDCQTVVKKGTAVSKHGHTVAGYTQVTAPTYTEKGTESGECSECRKTITREIPVLRTTVKLIYLGPGFGDSYDLYQTVDSAVPSSVRGTTVPGVKTEFNGRKLLYWTCSGVRVDEGTAIVWSKAGSGFCIPDYMENFGAGNVVYMQAVYEPLQE